MNDMVLDVMTGKRHFLVNETGNYGALGSTISAVSSLRFIDAKTILYAVLISPLLQLENYIFVQTGKSRAAQISDESCWYSVCPSHISDTDAPLKC